MDPQGILYLRCYPVVSLPKSSPPSILFTSFDVVLFLLLALQHILLASARDEHGVLLDQPLEVSVIVKDANDNTPGECAECESNGLGEQAGRREARTDTDRGGRFPGQMARQVFVHGLCP